MGIKLLYGIRGPMRALFLYMGTLRLRRTSPTRGAENNVPSPGLRPPSPSREREKKARALGFANENGAEQDADVAIKNEPFSRRVRGFFKRKFHSSRRKLGRNTVRSCRRQRYPNKFATTKCGILGRKINPRVPIRGFSSFVSLL